MSTVCPYRAAAGIDLIAAHERHEVFGHGQASRFSASLGKGAFILGPPDEESTSRAFVRLSHAGI